jgi:hypothetical protein
MNNDTSINLSSLFSNQFAENLFQGCLDKLSGLTELCFFLCGLFALVYFGNLLMKTWVKGSPIDFSVLIRPFIIGVVIMNFSLVYNLVDGILSPINSYTETLAIDRKELIKEKDKLADIRSEFREKEAALEQNGTTFWSNIFKVSSVSTFFDHLLDNCINLLLQSLEYLASIIFGAIKLTLRVISYAFRIILIVLGPFTFAISVLPAFKDNWTSWLGKYINVCLFIPIANIMDVIINKLNVLLIKTHIGYYQEAIQALTNSLSDVDSSLMSITISYIIFLIAFIVLYLMIPNIASYIVSAGTMEGLMGGITIAGSAAAAKMVSGVSGSGLPTNVLKFFKRSRERKIVFQSKGNVSSLISKNVQQC